MSRTLAEDSDQADKQSISVSDEFRAGYESVSAPDPGSLLRPWPHFLSDKEMEHEVSALETRLKSRRSSQWIVHAVTYALVLSIEVLVVVFRESLFYEPNLAGMIILMVTLDVPIGMMLYGLLRLPVLRVKARLDHLYRLKRTRRPTEIAEHEVTYFDRLVQINVENLAEYYSLIKVHTDNSFRACMVTGLVGFILIAAGLVSGAVSDTEMIAYVSSGAGVITEFIAGVFFYLYDRTIHELKEYHDSLIVVQNALLSFKIVGDIEDEAEKAKMVSQMIGALVAKENSTPAQP